ncbi:MAG TPA: hypothetical protein VFH39_03855 [Candidatus Saccharimonadales bacterium]|nr:hypothetical protein [Candidatus Saccharimonadales bacterium]
MTILAAHDLLVLYFTITGLAVGVPLGLYAITLLLYQAGRSITGLVQTKQDLQPVWNPNHNTKRK